MGITKGRVNNDRTKVSKVVWVICEIVMNENSHKVQTGQNVESNVLGVDFGCCGMGSMEER